MKTTGTFLSSDGIHTLSYTVYAPQGTPKAVLQISHGMCEYIGRYEEMALALNEEGILVCGHNHLGHGEAETLGYFAQKDGYRLLVQDVHGFRQLMQAQYPGVPYVLLGHSMGSFVARLYLTRYGEGLAGGIIMGTGARIPGAGAGRALARLLCALQGEKHRSALLQTLVFGAYNRRIAHPKTPFDWLSRDEDVVDRYMHDPQTQFVFTNSAFVDLITLQMRANREEWYAAVPKDLPLCLMSGDADPLGGYGKGIRQICDKLRRAGAQVEMKLYPGGRHEIVNELNRREVYADIAAFVRRCAGG